MRIIFETKNGKKYRWKATAWQKMIGYIFVGVIAIVDLYLWFAYAAINNL